MSQERGSIDKIYRKCIRLQKPTQSACMCQHMSSDPSKQDRCSLQQAIKAALRLDFNSFRFSRKAQEEGKKDSSASEFEGAQSDPRI